MKNNVESFQRARSREAKALRESTILDAARSLAAKQAVRTISLGDIADHVGMHKSALLRYFETREEIFLILSGECWLEWSAALRRELMDLETPSALEVSATLAQTLASRPMFCDLLAQAPLNLERNVSIDAIRSFKLIALNEVKLIGVELKRLKLSSRQATDVIATATSMAGAFWQMATPSSEVLTLYRNEPQLAHAVVDVERRLMQILAALISGFLIEKRRK
jgi:AcrR family transcriptional regulator